MTDLGVPTGQNMGQATGQDAGRDASGTRPSRARAYVARAPVPSPELLPPSVSTEQGDPSSPKLPELAVELRPVEIVTLLVNSLRPSWPVNRIHGALKARRTTLVETLHDAIDAALDPAVNDPEQLEAHKRDKPTHTPVAARCRHGLPLDHGSDRGIGCRTCLRQTLAEQTAADARQRRSTKRASILDALATRPRCACGAPVGTDVAAYDAGECRACYDRRTA